MGQNVIIVFTLHATSRSGFSIQLLIFRVRLPVFRSFICLPASHLVMSLAQPVSFCYNPFSSIGMKVLLFIGTLLADEKRVRQDERGENFINSQKSHDRQVPA